MKRLIPAVGYLRRSTHKQEKSLPDQRHEVERYAKSHGYTLVNWYQDDGISGDDTEKRAGFLAMVAAAYSGRNFDVILCWDQDRFGRFNSIESGYWIHPLVKAGVRLETVTDGPVNWNDFSGRIVHAVKQEGKHQFLVDLARNITRGQISSAKAGFSCGQTPPYGFDRMMVDEAGNHQKRVRRGEKYAKPRGWRVTFTPTDDAEVLRIVQWIFNTYASTDTGLRAMCDHLNGNGTPSPTGGKWCIGTLNAMLRKPAYCGDFVWNRRREGKYSRVSAGEVAPVGYSGGRRRSFRNPPEQWIVVKDAWEPLVDRATWDRIQQKLAARKQRCTPHRSKNEGRHLLSGLVYCEHCGAKMFGCRRHRTKNGTTWEYWKYVCSTYQNKGKEACGFHTIDQEPLLALLLSKLREAVLGGGKRDDLRERVLGRLRARQEANPAELETMRTRLAELDRQIEHGTKRVLRANDDVADLLSAALATIRRERDAVAAELAELDRPEPVDLDEEADRIVDRLWQLGEELEKAPPARTRELLHRMVARIGLRFDKVQKQRRVERPFLKGRIELRPDPIWFKGVFGQVSRCSDDRPITYQLRRLNSSR